MSHALPIPIPRDPVTVRPATAADLPFVDSLQKMHARQVGWMPMKSLEGKVAAGNVLVAELLFEVGDLRLEGGVPTPQTLQTQTSNNKAETPSPVGYCISTDRYMKREDCGIVYQVNVAPGRQRGLIGAALVKAALDRAAYGCRLFCCWCAQDIEANRFWESLGFLPLAFRAGSRDKGRVHIFWQRRVRADDEQTPYWFPSQTTGGSIREDRLVFPIPPGVHWRDEMPMVLPESKDVGGNVEDEKAKALPGRSRRPQHSAPFPPRSCISSGGLRLPAPKPVEPEPEPEPERAPKPKVRNDPRLVAAARELRDRWLERVNAEPAALASQGKYDVGRRIEDATSRRAGFLEIVREPAALPAPLAPAA